MAFIQNPQQKRPPLDRKDHVWFLLLKPNTYKCCLCGAIADDPPEYPTRNDWMPKRYEALTDEERGLAKCRY